MSYPGSPDKDPKVQQRILAAFREAVRLYREGHREECQTVLHSILEVDPAFRPAQRLESAIIHGQAVDLASLLGDVAEQATAQVDGLLAQARQALTAGEAGKAAELAQQVLRELPGHKEAKALLHEAQQALKGSEEVARQLQRVREALEAGLVEEAKAFLRLVRQVNPHHPELAELEARLATPTPHGLEVEFETFTPNEAMGFTSSEPTEEVAPPGEEGEVPPLEKPWEAAASPASGFSFEPSPEATGLRFGGEEAPASPEDRVAALLAEGQEAFDRGDYDGAVQTWTRIYLIEPHNQEAERRIEQARRRLDEINRLVEMRFAEAYEAFEQGDRERARALVQEVLALQPQHVDASDLLARLDTPAAPPPLPTEVPAVEEDLFRDEFVPQEISGEVVPAEQLAAVQPVARPTVKAAPKRALPLPLPVLLGIGLAVVALLVVGLVVGGRIWSSGPSLEETLRQAEELAQRGQLKDAINLLQALSLEGADANAVQQRILEYQQRLKARAPAAPALDLTPIRQALAEGKYLAAARLWQAANAKVRGDPALAELMQQIRSYDPRLPSLVHAWERANWEAAAALLEEMVAEHGSDAELVQAWQAARYNRAVALLRAFEVAEAAKVLETLHRETGDPEVMRAWELAKSYLARPVDPRYKIFVANLAFRQLAP